MQHFEQVLEAGLDKQKLYNSSPSISHDINEDDQVTPGTIREAEMNS